MSDHSFSHRALQAISPQSVTLQLDGFDNVAKLSIPIRTMPNNDTFQLERGMAYFVFFLTSLFAIVGALCSPKIKINGQERWSHWLWFFIVVPIIALFASSLFQLQSDSKEKHLLTTIEKTAADTSQANNALKYTSQQLRKSQLQQTNTEKQLSLANKRLVTLSIMVGKLVISEERSAHHLIISLGGKVLAAEDGHITRVSLAETSVTDDQLTEISRLSLLKELDLSKTKVSNVGVRYLPAFANLEILYLYDCSDVTSLDGLQNLKKLTLLELDYLNVTNNELQHLAELKGLKTLSLYVVSSVTDAGLVHLRELRNLKKLSLDGTKITDRGLDELKSLRNLEILSLSSNEITDDGLKTLQYFPKLEQLWLGYTKITDDGLAHLTPLANLFNLQIRHTGITDAGLPLLKNLPNLRHLNLTGTLVSDEGVTRLKKELPDLMYIDR